MATQAVAKQRAPRTAFAASPGITIKLVPDISWQVVTRSRMLKALEQGLDGYIEGLQLAIVQDCSVLITKQLVLWFGDGLGEIDSRLLKKLANSASTPGETANLRTVDYVTQLPRWSAISKNAKLLASLKFHMGRKGEDTYPCQIRIAISTTKKCTNCKKPIPASYLYVSEDLSEDDGSISNWHSECWIAHWLRGLLKEHRSAKGALDKQSKSVRAVLKGNSKSASGQGKIKQGDDLKSKNDYESWLNTLFENWRASTKVNPDFTNLYEKNFLEYAEQIADFHLTGKLSQSRAAHRLSKHLNISHVESVMEKFLEMPLKVLEYTGLKDPSANNQTVENHSTNQASSSKSLQIFKCAPRVFADSREVGVHLVAGNSVLMNLTEASEEDRKRIIDFASGLSFAQGGTIERVTPGIFLLTPPNVLIEDSNS